MNFYLKYLKAELLRRWGRALSISLGLAMASAIIIVIVSISNALSSAQKLVLYPLENVGTDIMVSRSINEKDIPNLDEAARLEYRSENRISTDLSKLGNPGDNFTLDNFLSGSLLSFEEKVTENMDKGLVKDYAKGLFLNVVHQEGKIPKVTAEFRAPAESIQQQMSPEQREQIREAMRKAEEEVRAKGLDPRSEEGRKALDEALKKYAPSLSFRIPERIFRQELGPISTDIKTENFTVAGVDLTKKDIGLILPTQIIQGNYFDGPQQIIVNVGYAEKKGIKIGDKLKLANTELQVVGFAEPKLYTALADLYLPLETLQAISGRKDRINILLVKSTDAKSVEETGKSLQKLFPGAKVTSSAEEAKQVSGSLISATNLVNKFIGITSLIVILAAFVIAGLISIISINKRIREIGTLKAIGWSNFVVIRQLFMENLVLGLFGAVFGVGLSILVIFLLNKYNISLSVSVAQQDISRQFLKRFVGEASSATTDVELKIAYDFIVMLIGAGVAVVGSILAGSLASFKASRLKPQEALRSLE